MTPELHCGTVFHTLRDPGSLGDASAVEVFSPGALVIQAGRIIAAGPRASLLPRYPDSPVFDWGDALILPGMVDAHLHAAQVDVIAAPAQGLLDWLTRHTFPTETTLADPARGEEVARFFFDQLVANGVTTAAVFPTTHRSFTEAVFAEGARRGLRLLCGKVAMDRHCPAALQDGDDLGRADTEALIARWHGQGRTRYVLTPRFAATSSREQLDWLGSLRRSTPDLGVHSHLAENREEIRWIAQLFPEARSYLDVYHRYGLTGPGCFYAHGIHVDDGDRETLAATETALVFCPSSNLFLGSGFFDLARARSAGVRVALGSDVGAGTSYSPLRTLAAAYGVLRHRDQTLHPYQGFWLATQGGAEALGLGAMVGNFLPGKEADFVVLDWRASPVLARRQGISRDFAERLFALMILGDERCIRATYLEGRQVFGPPPVRQRKHL